MTEGNAGGRRGTAAGVLSADQGPQATAGDERAAEPVAGVDDLLAGLVQEAVEFSAACW